MKSSNIQNTSPSLIREIRRENQPAWKRFVKLYTPLVYSWCRNYGLKAADVSDVAQEVFVAVHKNIVGFDPDKKAKGAFRSWLWGITRNKVKNHFRNLDNNTNGAGGSDRIRDLVNIEDEREPETVDGLQPRQILLQSAFEILQKEFNEVTWQCFWRMAVEMESASDIGKALNMSTKAVRQAKFRVTKKLRFLLEDDFPDLSAPYMKEED